jgi:membrane-associated phospholipid phosphatase
LLMLISRVIAGVHYPFDILAWIFIGIFSAFLVFKLLKNQKLVKNLNQFIIKMLSYIKL